MEWNLIERRNLVAYGHQVETDGPDQVVTEAERRLETHPARPHGIVPGETRDFAVANEQFKECEREDLSS